MTIQVQKIEPHWNYFLAIERDLERLSRFIDFDERNFECFGIETARLLLACGAEIDVICKQICRLISPDSTASKINEYRQEIVPNLPKITEFEVVLPRFGITLHPWENWGRDNGNPEWWTAYNKTKHERDTEYHRANLKNALNAVAGLYAVVVYLNGQEAEQGNLVPSPQLLRPGGAHFGGTAMGDYEMGICYNL